MRRTRMTPLTVAGRTIHQIGLPYHWGPNGYSTGDAVNEPSAIALDPHVHIQEVKALTPISAPEAESTSYHGKPILNPPSWDPLNIAGYFFLSGLAGAGSVCTRFGVHPVRCAPGSVCTRFGAFHAGVRFAEDPRYTVVPQRERLRQRQ